MIFWSLFLGLIIALIFLFFRGSNRNQNIVPQHIHKPLQENFNNLSKTEKYSNLRTYLEKAFAKKREEKYKFYYSLLIIQILNIF